MYISEVLVQKHQRRGPKQTGKFSTVLQMFPPTVSSHECWVADCSRYEGQRQQMICHLVQFLCVEPRASKYQPISCQDDECRPGDSTQLDHRRTSNEALTDQCCKFVDNHKQPVQWL